MIIFVYGDDTFRVQEKVDQLKSAFKEKHDTSGMNTDVFPIEGKLVIGDVLQSIRSAPFLGDKRMVIVKGLIESSKKEEEKVWLEGLEKTPDSTIVILWETIEPKKLEKKSLFKKISDLAQVHSYPFAQLEGRALQAWVQKRINDRGGSIDSPALTDLLDRVGADLWHMDNEIQKLIAYANGQITKDMVSQLVRPSFEGAIFDLIDAVSKKQTKKALQLLQEERLSGANDFYLVSMLARQIRILLGARALLEENPRAQKQELADAMSIHPFVAQKALQQARPFSLDDLLETHSLLFSYDRKMKTGGITADLAVDLLAADLTK